jgi:hypothetical protein
MATRSYGYGGVPVARMQLSACYENVGGILTWYEAAGTPIYMYAGWYFNEYNDNSQYSYDTDSSWKVRLPIELHGIAIWQWDFDGNGTFDDWDSALVTDPPCSAWGDSSAVYSTPGVYNLKLKVTDDDAYEELGNNKSAEKTYRLAIVNVGLSAPALVAVNWDDDDQDGITDSHDGFNKDGIPGNDDDANPNENELVPVTISFAPQGLPGTVAFSVSSGGGLHHNIKVWSGPPPQKGNLIMPTNDPDPDKSHYIEIPTTALPKTYYIEGTGTTPLQGSYVVYLCASYISPGRNCNVGHKSQPITVLEVDMDMDGVKDDEIRLYPGVTEEMKPGGFIVLNDDDDNNNETPDKDENGPILGENDLVKITLWPVSPTQLPIDSAHPITLKAIAGGEKVKVWGNSTKEGTPITLPVSWTSRDSIPYYLWIEGVQLSSTPRDITLALEYAGFEDRIRMTVFDVKVDKVVKAGTTDEGPLYACLYDTVYLEAKPYPADASFPAGEPHWTIESQPIGGNALLSLSSGTPIVALYNLTEIGDYVIKARCGTADTGDTITVTVYRVVTETVSPIPANRDRTLLGIGEQVKCWTEPAVEVIWDVELDWGYVNPETGTNTTFTAFKTPLYPSIYVTPTAGGCSHILNFAVIAPTGENNVLWSDMTPGTMGPPNRQIGSEHIFTATVLPTSVSFRWVEFRENIPTNTWKWPDGTVESWYPGPCSFIVGYDNRWLDSCRWYPNPIERIYDGSNYVDFTIPLSIPEEYKNESGNWVPFLPGEYHDVKYRGADQTSRHVIRATNDAPGSWMGPWQ